jgi:hypothetical protein
MISVLMIVATAVRLPCNLAWRGYGLLWWAFAENESLRDIWATPSRAVRVGWWLSVVGLFVAAAGAIALGLNELASPARAFMGFAWAAVLVVAGSAFVGPRLARRSESPRPARGIDPRRSFSPHSRAPCRVATRFERHPIAQSPTSLPRRASGVAGRSGEGPNRGGRHDRRSKVGLGGRQARRRHLSASSRRGPSVQRMTRARPPSHTLTS